MNNQLIESETRYRAIVEDQTEFICRWNFENGILFVNDAACKYLNISSKKLIGSSWERFVYPDDIPLVRESITAININNPVSKIEHRLVLPNNDIKWVEFRNHAFFDTDGRIIGFQSVGSDITLRKNALQKLKESESFTLGILNSMTSHIAVIDKTGTILMTNDAWNKFSVENGGKKLIRTGVGVNYFEVCEKSIKNGDKLAKKALKGLKSLLNKKIKSFELEYPCHSEGEERWFLMSANTHWDEDAKIVIRHVNITERKRKNEKTLLDSQILSALTDAVVYCDLDFKILEWNTNANDIFGFEKAELLQQRLPDILRFQFPKEISEWRYLDKLINEGKCAYDLEAKTKKEETVYVSVNSSLLKNEIDKPIGIVTIMRNITEKILQEKALERSELNYKELFDQSSFGIINLDIHGRIQTVNNKLSELTGFSKYKFIGKHLLTSPFKAKPIDMQPNEIFEKILTIGDIGFVFEAKVKRANDEILHCEISSRFIKEINQVSLIVRDVTSERKIEKFNLMIYNLANFTNSSNVNLVNFGTYLKEQLSGYFNTENFCISSYNHDFNELEFVYSCNDSKRDCQKPLVRRNVNGLTEFVISHKEAMLLNGEELAMFCEKNNIVEFNKDAKSWMGVPLIADSVSVGCIAVQTFDNNKKYTNEDFEVLVLLSSFVAPIIEKLKNDRKLLLVNSAIEEAGEAVFITNPKEENNPIIFINQKFKEVTGYSALEVYGKNKEALLGPKSSKLAVEKIRDSFRNSVPFHGEVLLYKKDGSTFWSDLAISPIKNAQGETTNFIGIQNDITLKKEMERKLIEKNKELELFMYRSSHDLKGPLATSKGLLKFALEECTDENITHYLQLIDKSNNKLDNILSELMEIVLIREGDIINTPININSLINEVIESYVVIEDNSKTVTILKKINVNEEIFIDAKLLKIIFRNIFNNAVKYYDKDKPNSFVNIEADIENGQLVIKTSDNGIGVKQNYINKIFDMFFRATDSSTGTGLGLYITKNAIEKLMGTISIESEENVGTSVIIKIPI